MYHAHYAWWHYLHKVWSKSKMVNQEASVHFTLNDPQIKSFHQAYHTQLKEQYSQGPHIRLWSWDAWGFTIERPASMGQALGNDFWGQIWWVSEIEVILSHLQYLFHSYMQFIYAVFVFSDALETSTITLWGSPHLHRDLSCDKNRIWPTWHYPGENKRVIWIS